MPIIQVELSDDVALFVREQAAKAGYDSEPAYVASLVEHEQKRTARDRLERLLIEGVDSGPPIPVDGEYWERKRSELLTKFEQRDR